MTPKLLLALGVVLVAASPQGKEGGGSRPKPPENAKALPPVQEPFRAAVERADLIQRFGGPSPLEGHYRLTNLSAPGVPTAPAEGYLVAGRRHLSIHLQAPTANGEAMLQSAYRSYRIEDRRVHMTSLSGFRTMPGGVIAIEQPGTMSSHAFTLIGTRLQLRIDGGRVLEFQRIE